MPPRHSKLLPIEGFQVTSDTIRRRRGFAFDGPVGIDHDPADGADEAQQNHGDKARNEMGEQVHGGSLRWPGRRALHERAGK